MRQKRVFWMLASVGALAVVVVPIARAQTAAPPSHADATAAEVGDVVAVADTEADANGESGEATANAVEVGGEPLSEQTGGTQSGDGQTQGELLDTGDTPVGNAQVAPHNSEVSSDSDSRDSHGDAALARAELVPTDDGPLIGLAVLDASSTASHTDAASTGSAVSDGAVVDLFSGELVIKVLHAETTSGAPGSTALVVINDTPIGTQEQVGALCNIDLSPLAALGCLTASGGPGLPSAAQVGDVVLGDDALDVNIVAVGSLGNPGGGDGGDGGNGGDGGDGIIDGEAGRGDGGGAGADGGLAFTGLDDRFMPLALGLLLLGAVLAGVRRTRRPVRTA